MRLFNAVSETSLSFWIIGALFLFGFYFLGSAIYSLYFGPLAKYPGPFFAKISSWPNFYHTLGGDRHIWLWQCHQFYGPVFRYRPDGIMTNSPSAHHEIYSAKANVKKGVYYRVWPKNHNQQNTWSVTDRKQHVQKRRVLSNAFSDRAVRAAEQFVIRHVDRWCELLIQDAGNGWSKPRNIARWSEFLVFDILTDLCFGKSFEIKEPGENELKDVPSQMAASSALFHRIGNAPFTPLWVWLKPRGLDYLFQFITPAKIKKFYDFVETSVIERSKLEIANPFDDSNEHHKEAHSEKPTGGRNDMFHYLFQSKDPDTGKMAYTPDELFGEAVLLIIAGADTTTTAISAAFFYLTHNPHVLATLKHELLATFTSVDEIRSGPKLSSCKYLRACLEESMRMSPPVAGDLNREVLPGGMQLEGDMIPAGTNVATDTYALHHNEQIFPDPFHFRPERWIADENNKTMAADVARAESAFSPFSVGPRVCLGKNLAYLELMVTMGRVLYRMDIVQANDDEEGGKVG
ncbi:hypothetical protein MMC31_003777, partial [Peltigera leucophlebia]|nr:hypothetical protein [Peltigera leucophlebia]